MLRQRISPEESARISDLESRLGSVRLRTLLTGERARLLRPDRLSRLKEGRGRLSATERETLGLIGSNSVAVENLAKKNRNKPAWKVNRSIRDWLLYGKERGIDFQSQDAETRENQLTAIRSLRFLGIEPSEGTYYVRRRKA